MRRTYLDNNATTAVLPQVQAAMLPYFGPCFGHPSAIYLRGREARNAVEQGRDSVARLLGCRKTEVVFTSGGAEGNNLAIFGLTHAGDLVITSSIEHDSVLAPCTHLERTGCDVTRLPVDAQGAVDPDDVRRAIRKNTRLISVMMANHESGVIQPVEEIGRIASETGAYFHTDAVQAAGKIRIDVDRIGCHLLTIASHKFHGPQGCGALYVKRGVTLKPLLFGGSEERDGRAGTENVPGIVGFGRAAELAQAGLDSAMLLNVAEWRDKLETALVQRIEATGLIGKRAPRLPNTSSIFFDYANAASMVLALDQKGIAVSAGASCSSGSRDGSHVLLAMGLSQERARATLRFSLGKLNQAEDIDYVLSVVPEVVQRLRGVSPVYRKTKAIGTR